MRRLFMLALSTLMFCLIVNDHAEAQRYGGGRWAAGGVGWGTLSGRPGWGAAGIRPGWRAAGWRGYRSGWGGGWAGYRPGWRWAGYRPGWGYNRPWYGAAALGLASAGYYSSYYYPYAYASSSYYPSAYGAYGYNDCSPVRARYAYY